MGKHIFVKVTQNCTPPQLTVLWHNHFTLGKSGILFKLLRPYLSTSSFSRFVPVITFGKWCPHFFCFWAIVTYTDFWLQNETHRVTKIKLKQTRNSFRKQNWASQEQRCKFWDIPHYTSERVRVSVSSSTNISVQLLRTHLLHFWLWNLQTETGNWLILLTFVFVESQINQHQAKRKHQKNVSVEQRSENQHTNTENSFDSVKTGWAMYRCNKWWRTDE